jgi:hypothetical protein
MYIYLIYFNKNTRRLPLQGGTIINAIYYRLEHLVTKKLKATSVKRSLTETKLFKINLVYNITTNFYYTIMKLVCQLQFVYGYKSNVNFSS